MRLSDSATMRLLRQLADNQDPGSLASRLRRRRFAAFQRLISDLPRPVEIIDVGGSELFWRNMDALGDADPQLRVTIVNVSAYASSHPAITMIQADATDLSMFDDRQFDVAFSNSVIEHVGGEREQRLVASEISRVARGYFVQTPDRFFPIEPHFLFPLFQFLPVRARVWLAMRWKWSWFGRPADERAARELVESVRLLSAADMRRLFPDAELQRERVLGLSKSLVAVRRA